MTACRSAHFTARNIFTTHDTDHLEEGMHAGMADGGTPRCGAYRTAAKQTEYRNLRWITPCHESFLGSSF